MVDDITEKSYNTFVVNRTLSYFPDTALLANEMNQCGHIGAKLQYHFLLNIVRKKKRFAKWGKADSIENIELVKQYYNYSTQKAIQALSLLTDDQIKELREKTAIGGRKRSYK